MGVSIESIHGYIYSAAFSARALYRAPIDGSSRETVIDKGKIQFYNANSFSKGMFLNSCRKIVMMLAVVVRCTQQIVLLMQ